MKRQNTLLLATAALAGLLSTGSALYAQDASAQPAAAKAQASAPGQGAGAAGAGGAPATKPAQAEVPV